MKTAADYRSDQVDRAQASRTRDLWIRRGDLLLRYWKAPDFVARGALQAEILRLDEQLRRLGENP
jgi:hypothetical protein